MEEFRITIRDCASIAIFTVRTDTFFLACMETFTRRPLWYWSDRLAYVVLCGGLGVVFLVASVVALVQADTPNEIAFLMIPMGIPLIIFGVWTFCVMRHPVRITVDRRGVEIAYRPGETIRIPREAVADIQTSILIPGGIGGRHNAVVYTQKGETHYAVVYSGYTDAQGRRYTGKALIRALQEALKRSA